MKILSKTIAKNPVVFTLISLILSIAFGAILNTLSFGLGFRKYISSDPDLIFYLLAASFTCLSFALLQTLQQSLIRQFLYEESEIFRNSLKKDTFAHLTKIQNKADAHLKEFEENAIRSVVENAGTFSVIPLGNSEDAFHYLNLQLESANVVKNTVVGLGSSKQYDKSLNSIYKTFFEKNRSGVWEDIVSHAEVHGARFQLKDARSEWEDRHRVYVLDKFIPIINFTIVRYSRGPKASGSRLFIGWTSALNYSEQNIFVTQEEGIIRVFEAYFDLLKRYQLGDPQGSAIDFSLPPANRVQKLEITRKQGVWLTLSFHLDATESETPGSDISYDTWAIVRISNDFEGVSVSGTAFQILGDLKAFEYSNEIRPQKKDIYSFLNRMYFEYSYSRHNIQKLGFCVYNFDQGISSEPCFFGSYIDVQTRDRSEIVAVKISNDECKCSDQEALEKFLESRSETLSELCRRRAVSLRGAKER